MSFSLSKYQLLEKIGEGSYGEVFTIQDKRTHQIYVAKIPTNGKNISKEKLNEEIEKISKLESDPCISKFIGFSPKDFKKKDNPVIVNEFISNDTLRKLLNLELAGSAPRAWDINKKLINVFGIASGMRELHSKGIVHGNLKPENILLDSYLYPKVCDYGISKTISTSSFSSSNCNEWFIYLSPEIVDGEGPSEKGDVYAFAFIAYEIMTGKKPFENLTMRQIMDEIAKGKRPSFRDVKPAANTAFVVLLSHCWSKDPQKRLSFDEIIEKLKSPRILKVLTDDTEYQNYIKYVESKSSKPNPEPPKISLYTESEEIQEESESNNSDVSDDSEKNDDDDDDNNNDEEYPKDRICPKEIFGKLTEENQEFIKTADGDDKEAQYEVGLTFVEQKRKIPYNSRNRIIGFKYLLKSLENGKEESGIYYSRHCKSKQETKLGTKFVGKHSDSSNPSIIFGIGIISLQQKKLQRAKEFFEKGSKMKNSRCIHYLGIMYRDGIYFEQDSEKAVELFSKAKDLMKEANEPKKTTDEEDTAENLYSKGIQNKSDNIEDSIYFFELASKKGDVKSMKELYEIYYEGIQSIEYDYGKAFKYAKMGADKGDVELMRKTAEMYENGEGTDENISKAAKYYKMAADKDDVESMNKYGLMLDQGEGIKADKEKACYYYKKAAENGNKYAMYNYALMLISGDGTEKDINEAIKYLQNATALGYEVAKDELIKVRLLKVKEDAENGDAGAMIQYAKMLEEGKGVKKDIEKAKKLYKSAADKGNAKGCIAYAKPYNLKIIQYLKDQRAHKKSKITQDELNEARKITLKYYKIAAEKKNAVGMFQYGLILEHGNGVKVNKDEAAKLYLQSAKKGHPKAMMNIARCLELGIGVDKNEEEALKWYYKAKRKGNNDADPKIRLLNAKLKKKKAVNDDDDDDDDEIIMSDSEDSNDSDDDDDDDDDF